jgi:hypothetical protein
MSLALLIATEAQAQVGPARAHPIHGATQPLPMMLIEQKPRKVVLDVFVDASGRVTGSAVVLASGNGIFDERMRGYWKATPFMPALDGDGNPRPDTIRITNTFSETDRGSLSLKQFRNHSEVESNLPADSAARLERMRCRDLVWEFEFMQRRAPKAGLLHEDIFQVAFAMFLAAGDFRESARDALIGEWSGLVERTLAGCREKPDAFYWQEVFVPLFTRAAPPESAPVN